MLPPQACVAIEIAGPPTAMEQRAALEGRCSEILGPRRCRVITPPEGQLGGETGSGCWRAQVIAAGGGTPTEASVVLSDASAPDRRQVRRDITFRANDAVPERWATLGLVIAALVTVEEHSAAEEAPALPPLPPVLRVDNPLPDTDATTVAAVRASAVAALGLLPGTALGARLEACLARRHLGVLARATFFPEHNRAALGSGSAGGAFQLVSAGVGGCGIGGSARLGARACAGGDLATTRARGFGVAQTNSATAWSESVWVTASLEWRVLHHLALTVEAEGAALIQRPTFAINGAGAFTPSPVTGSLALGLAVPF